MIKAIKLCIVFMLITTILGIPSGFANNAYIFFPLLWTLICFGASVLPSSTGVIISCVNKLKINFFNIILMRKKKKEIFNLQAQV